MIYGGSETPYVPRFNEQDIGLNPLIAADDFGLEPKYGAYEPTECARRSFDGFTFAGHPSAAGSWNLPSTPDLATDESSFYSSAMSRSTSLVSSYLPANLTGNVGAPWAFNDPFVTNKTQFGNIGALFDGPVSPSEGMFVVGYPSSAAADHGSITFSPTDMDRSFSSTTTSSDPLTSIALPNDDESPRRHGNSPFFHGSAPAVGDDAGPSSSRKLKIERVHRDPVRLVANNHHGLLCEACDRNPDGFRGEHELSRHKRLFHDKKTRKWVCADLSVEDSVMPGSDWYRPKLGLDQCQNCRAGKQYGQYYNAAAHLRRYHFYPKPRGRPKGDERPRRRAGSAGGNEPSIAVLKKYWLRAVEVRNPHGSSDDGEAEEAEDEAAAAGDDEEERHQQQHQQEQQQQLLTPWQPDQQRRRDRMERWALGEGGEGAAEEAPFTSLSARANYGYGYEGL
jgi:hypothetical protein